MYIISGRGRKSGVARATEATASLAPLLISLEMAESLKLFIMVHHDAGKIFYYHGVIQIHIH